MKLNFKLRQTKHKAAAAAAVAATQRNWVNGSVLAEDRLHAAGDIRVVCAMAFHCS